MTGVSGGADPYYFVRNAVDALYLPADGKTVTTPRLTAGENTAIIVVAGQSNASNNVNATYSPSNSTKIDNLNLFDGGTYRAADPLVGCDERSGNLFLRLADKLISAGIFARVILAPIGVSSTTVAQWASGGVLNARLEAIYARIIAVGLTPTMWLWQQGESDTLAGTGQSAYTTSMAQVIATPRNKGDTAPWFLGKSTYIGGSVSAAVQAAIDASITGTIYAGANTDTLTGTAVNRQVNDVHFTAAGADAAADLWKTKIDVVF